MLRPSLMYVVAMLLLTANTATTRAADISCDLSYGQSNPFRPKYSQQGPVDFSTLPPLGDIDGVALDPDLARRHWPSGSRPKQSTCQVAFLQGKIEKQDFDKVLAFYRRHHPFLHHVRLISPGGDVEAALKIGRLFRKYLVAVSAPDTNSYLPFNDGKDGIATQNACRLLGVQADCICASACAFIWFGAPDRSGVVGLHRPRFTDPRFKHLPPSEATTAYRQLLQSIARYLEEMEAPKTIIDTLASTGSDEMTWIEDGFNNLSDGLRIHRAPSYAEWVTASCGNWSHEDHKAIARLIAKEALKGLDQQSYGLTKQERQRFKALLAKSDQQRTCEFELTSASRDRMPPP